MYNIKISFLNKELITCLKVSKITYKTISWNREVTDMIIEGDAITALTIDVFTQPEGVRDILFHGDTCNYAPNLEYMTLIEIEKELND